MEILLLLFLSISAFIALKLIFPKSHSNKKLPPGPPSIPFLLNFIWQRKSIFDVEPLLRELHAKHGPIISVNIGFRLCIFIADSRVAHRALIQNGAAFADRPPAVDPNILFTCNQHDISTAPYGNFWRLLRRNLSSEILHPSRVKLFAPARRWVLGILLEKLETQREANEGITVVVESFHYAMFCLLGLMCFGEKLEEKTIIDIQVIESEMILSFTKFPIFAFFPKIMKLLFRKRWMEYVEMRRKLEEIFIPLIRARRDNDKKKSFDFSYVDSILDLEIQEEEQERKLTEDEMVTICSEFLTAGTDTTATPLQWIMANLVKRQEVQARFSIVREGS
ncbi:cytochrome P450 89A2-like [Typha angustifolia]|uniref:cytochrome P450 89A2-like n=1 Tax=Typha angustifolia TaxID=59011 RepID=UPI003C307277